MAAVTQAVRPIVAVAMVTGGFCIAAYLLAALLQVPGVSETRWANGLHPATIGLVAGALLASDALLPVPSSLLLLLLGATLGFAGGTAVGLAGLMAGSSLIFWLGQHGRGWASRRAPAEPSPSTSVFVTRWGGIAVALSRPVPLLAESIAAAAGAAAMDPGTFARWALAGNLATAAFWAAVGAAA